MKRIGKVNLIFLLFVLLVLCMLMFGGLPRVIAWAVLKLIFRILGALLLISTLLLIILRFSKDRLMQRLLSLLIGLIYLAPMLVTLNIVPIAYPAKAEKVTPSLTVAWPLAEKGIVGWGGETLKSNLPHAMWGSERWAYDLVMTPYNTNDKKLSDYGIYQQTVVAPIEGTIIEVLDNERDILPGSEDFLSMEGNHIYMKVKKTGTYLLLNHLAENSAEVKVGDKVLAGEVLGKVGNSGSTSEPHLHIHHQRQDPTEVIHPLIAEGLPLYFSIDGEKVMPKKDTPVAP